MIGKQLLAVLLVGLVGSSLLSCADRRTPVQKLVPEVRPTNLKILLVGIDGATLNIISPLIDQGRLPQTRRLIENGAHGILRSDPPISSPAIWTSIVTGRNREAHGIRGFLQGTGTQNMTKKLVTSNDRKVTALWNWLGPFGKTVGFSGWWASWPAEPTNGWIVSDRITRSRWSEWYDGAKDQKLTFPGDLIVDLWPLVVDPSKPPMDEIESLVRLNDSEKNEFLAARKPVLFHGLSVFKFAYCAQRSYENFALSLLDQGQPDLTGVFLIATDPVCHTFWHFYEPHAYSHVEVDQASRLGKLIPNLYEHNDRYLSELLAKVDSNTVVIIVSDHGFQATGKLPSEVDIDRFDELQSEAMRKGTVAVGQSGDHDLDGVIIATGPFIRRGVTIAGAHVFDITPTILALLGLPLPDDLNGRVLTEMIEPSFFEEHPIRRISSYEDYFDREQLAISDEVPEDELLQRLRALGYIK